MSCHADGSLSGENKAESEAAADEAKMYHFLAGGGWAPLEMLAHARRFKLSAFKRMRDTHFSMLWAASNHYRCPLAWLAQLHHCSTVPHLHQGYV
jgi:hypothetical protein